VSPEAVEAEARGARDQAGFTLVELLIVIVIEALIVGGLGSAFVLVMNNSASVKDNLSRTEDARIAAQYIVSDARNSSGPETSLSDTASCPDANPPVAGAATAVVRFNWDSTSSAGVTSANVVNYVLVSNALLRRQCHNGTLVSDIALATNITSVAVACAPIANCTGTPTTITATVTETQDSAGGAAYQYSLTGAFRKALAVGAELPTAGSAPLVVLGQACANGYTGIKMSSTSNLHVHGDVYVNTANSGACEAINLAGSATITSSGSTKVLTGGTCVAGTSVCPAITSYSPAVSDPLAGLASPSTAGMPSQSGCAGGTAQPGVYASILSVSSGATCNLASGVYVLQAGMSATNTSTITTGAGGVLIYITGGTLAMSGSADVTLTAMTSGAYSDVAVWQAASDTTTMTIGGSTQPTFTGAVYVPKAQITMSSTSQPTMSKLVLQDLTIQNSSAPVIGTQLSVATPAMLPAWTVNVAYPATTIVGAGGDGGPYTFSASGLPAGLSINATTGVISGTPTAAGAPTATITVNDAFGDPARTKQYTVTINAAPSVTSTSPLPSAGLNVAYSTTLTKSGGTGPYIWSATGLPAGLSIDAATGVISGTPTAAGTPAASVTLTDAAGATANKALSITVNAAPVITSVLLSNTGSVAGKLEKGDSIVVTFSAQLSVSSLCSTWSGDGANQSLNSNGDVNVNISNGTSGVSDVLTVTSNTCTFDLGSIDLGSGSYVSSAVAFGGNGVNKSSIAWNATTHALTITFGALKTGTVTTVASSAAIYSASGSIVDTFGNAISNSPYTLPNGRQF
jgi:prepilin-type N-terminal cleavage/methylation domain-containing protein